MTKIPKMRADEALVRAGLARSRSRARALITEGKVCAGDVLIQKPGQSIAENTALHLTDIDHPWVSRGGLKLAHALKHFKVSLKDKIVLDIGASTGGFSDVALNNGAGKVYAVDVGQGQLDRKLRNDPRIVVMDGVNARHLSGKDIPEPLDAIICDASFISLKTILPAPLALLKPGGMLIALIKPQFEVGKGKVGKGGVVRDPALHVAVAANITAWLQGRPGWRVLGVTESPVTGPKGNREFLIAATFMP